MKQYVVIVVILAMVTGLSFKTKNDGIAGRTGSPGETTCNTFGCHTGNQLNDPSGSISINAPGLQPTWEYIPGNVYQIEITVTRTGNSKFGFSFESLLPAGSNAGTLSITDAVSTQLKSVTVGGNPRTNVLHRLNSGLSTDSHTFTFSWTAPAAGTGPVTFYTAGNAANGQNNTSDDYIFSTSQLLSDGSSVGLQESFEPVNIMVTPNPANDHILVSGFKSEGMLKLFDLRGKLVYETMISNPNVKFFRINIDSSFSDGIYFLTYYPKNYPKFTKKVAIFR